MHECILLLWIVTLSNKEKVTAVFPVTSVEVEVTGAEAILSLCFSTQLLGCLMKTVGRSRVNGWQNIRWMSI